MLLFKRKKTAASQPLWVLLLICALVTAQNGLAAAKQTVQVGMNVAWPPDVMLALAVAKGLVPSQYDVHVKILQDPLTAYSLLASGRLDILDSPPDYVPVAVAKGLPIVTVSMTDLSYGADKIVTRKKVSQPADIKGQSVAAPQAYLGELLMGLWLDKLGVKASEVNWVDLNAPDAVGPMMTGKVAAAYLYSPWVSKVVDRVKGSQVAASTAQRIYLRTGMFGDAIYMNKTFIKNSRDAARALLKARFKGLQYWHDHTAEANQFIANFLNWPLADVRSIIGTNGKAKKGGLYLFDFNQSARYCGVMKGDLPFGIKNGQWPEAAAMTNRWWVKVGLLERTHDVSRGIDCSLLKDLVDSGFRQSMSRHAGGGA